MAQGQLELTLHGKTKLLSQSILLVHGETISYKLHTTECISSYQERKHATEIQMQQRQYVPSNQFRSHSTDIARYGNET